jgi:hypothetical protein
MLLELLRRRAARAPERTQVDRLTLEDLLQG